MPPSTPPAARLLNLVIALMNTSGRMTKDEIRSSVAGYDDATSTDAFERMFERDKDALRDMGVPIVAVDTGGHSQDAGYRIDKDAYALAELDLTPAEVGVLSLAAQFWQDTALHVDTARALTKLRSVPGAGDDGTDTIAGLSPRVRPLAGAYEPLLDAITARRVVTFTYRAASTGQVRTRTVEPWRVAVRGGWYLLGHDRDRDAPRSFRLTRVEGTVHPTGPPGAFTPPADVDVDTLIGLATPEPTLHALLAVRPERASALRARATTHPDHADNPVVPGRDVLRVHFTTLSAAVHEIAGYGDAIVVLDPPDLRDAVVTHLTTALHLTPTRSTRG
ncbi:helix-turn-helix transcriptional regulator [Sanguibacter suaedae]|uniref:WYL domain-containing protein n=1 Tax=Sanguibacter suaedae TaxID=2795737 RepID=A0A934I8H0_9MICO|nr:WYL domain-containing protein [Sanguibacter suaedae]MBI9116161.1 WYL domain-containing protein [Sanguibacter suaedae]